VPTEETPTVSTRAEPRLYPATYAATQPEKSAFIVAETGEVVTYGELDRSSLQLARVLRTRGCRPGDRIAILLDNHRRFAEVCWAANRSGLHYVPVNTRLTPAEVEFIVNDSGALAVITSAGQGDRVRPLRPRCPTVATWLMSEGVVDGFESYEDVVGRESPTPLPDETEGAVMLYSSGTTGRPKGILRPLSGQPPGSTILGHDTRVSNAYDLTGDSVVFVPSPLYHSMGVHRLMMAQSLGATVVVMRKFDAEGALRAVETYRVTHAGWVPTMFVRMLRLDPAVRNRYDLSSMVAASVGSGPCPDWVKQAMIDWWGPIITEIYGGSEGMAMTRITSEDWMAHRGSVGRPVYGEPHILRADGSEAATGEEGVIYFAAGRSFEYHGDPDKTASVRSQQGWTTLGDIGYLDPDGYLYVTDRSADLIITGGANVYPREVEEALLRHPAVEDVAVIGVPDDEYGEIVKAIVQLRTGYEAGTALERELTEFSRQAIAGYKCPRVVEFVDDLPRHDTGKLYKRHLRHGEG
jgi:acyl-CoA synthetase (AMP-forming)/AMP-acid ligase II